MCTGHMLTMKCILAFAPNHSKSPGPQGWIMWRFLFAWPSGKLEKTPFYFFSKSLIPLVMSRRINSKLHGPLAGVAWWLDSLVRAHVWVVSQVHTGGMPEATDPCFSHTWMFLSLPTPLSENKK